MTRTMQLPWVALVALAFLVMPADAVPEPGRAVHILFDAEAEAPDLVTVRVVGLGAVAPVDGATAPWRRILRVVALEPGFHGNVDELPGLLGAYEQVDLGGAGELRFRPRFPPAPGLELRASFDGAAWDRLAVSGAPTPSATATFRVPDLRLRPRARVVAVEPGPAVPSNLLRLYVHFSRPMAARGVPEHVRLLDDEGRAVDTAFVDIPDGLWDPQRRRLTLLVHPGRVKRGVGPRQVLGPVLEAGKSYTLRVEGTAVDADGVPLVASFEHRLEVGAPDHRPPAPESWRLEPPAGPRQPLRVMLLEPADRALLQRLPTVLDAAEQTVPGQVEVSADGMVWTFTPQRPWVAGSYRLAVPAELEDPAGNRPGRAFEAAASERGALPTIYLSFELDLDP